MAWFKPRNPTAGWVECPSTVPVLDLDAFALNGTGIGDPARMLEFLGPGTPGETTNEFEFPARGVALEIRKETFRAVHLYFPAFRGVVRLGGHTLIPDAHVGLDGWVARCGEPDVIEDEILTYLSDEREWEIILESGRLKSISLF